MAAGDDEAIRAVRADVDRLEHKADEIKHDIRSNMPRRLMMAMERRDLLDILDCQDSIADVTQDIAELVDQRAIAKSEGFEAWHADARARLLASRGREKWRHRTCLRFLVRIRPSWQASSTKVNLEPYSQSAQPTRHRRR